MVSQINPTGLQANSFDIEAPFLDMDLSITNGIVSPKIYDKRDDFNFEIVNFPYLDGDIPRSTSYGVDVCLFFFVALRPKSTAMVIAGLSVHLTTLFPGQA